MSEESIDVSELKNTEERCMLEGLIGYANYLLEEMDHGKLKTVEEISKKISNDAEHASGALSYHFRDKLKVAGFVSGLFEESTKKEAEA
jgi:hypothetical protein